MAVGADRRGDEDLSRLVQQRGGELARDVDGDVSTALSNLLWVAGDLLGQLETEVHRPSGWSWAGFRIMLTAYLLGPLEPRVAARLAGVTRASISAVLNTLERDGLVERRRESADRRVVAIVLTEQGRKAVRLGFRRHHEVERRFAAPLDRRELVQLNELLQRLLASRDGSEPGDGRREGFGG